MPEYKVHVRVDAREKVLIDMLKLAYPPGDKELAYNTNLHIGDIQFLVDGQVSMIVERKEVGDFKSCVFKRFRTQRARMLLARKDNPNIVLMFIFEGDLANLFYQPGTKVTKAFLESLQNDLEIKYGILVRKVADYRDTLRFIGRTIDSYKKHGGPLVALDKITAKDAEIPGEKLKREDPEDTARTHHNPRDFLRVALGCISGVSPEKAQTIVNHYHNMPNLIHVYKRLANNKQRQMLLSELKGDGETRKLGKVLSSRIFAALMGDTESNRPVLVTENHD